MHNAECTMQKGTRTDGTHATATHASAHAGTAAVTVATEPPAVAVRLAVIGYG
jgi:hypothetical protein